MKKIKIILVDDHQMFREGLKFVLTQIPEFEIIGEASNGQEYLNLLETSRPDVVLMDIGMPVMDGIAATERTSEHYPQIDVIALSMFSDQEYYHKMVSAGVKGFLIKEAGIDELEKAIKSVHLGNAYFSQELLRSIIVTISNPKVTSKDPLQLTKREEEVMQMICKGYTTKEISDLLFISQKTVEGHKTNLLAKTNSKNTINLMLYAFKNRLVEV
ncbi:MAG TPA: response regulator transcription factor [Chryseolinea sp.]|nr:response regulator transcription factor [Chryseolinea sp.]